MIRLFIQTLLIMVIAVITGCSPTDKAEMVEQAELLSRIQDQSVPVILDVRSEAEYQNGHIPGAINLPYPDYQQPLEALKLQKGQEIIVYCETGGRAGKVEADMETMGFFEVRHLKGDMHGWREAGLVIAR